MGLESAHFITSDNFPETATALMGYIIRVSLRKRVAVVDVRMVLFRALLRILSVSLTFNDFVKKDALLKT